MGVSLSEFYKGWMCFRLPEEKLQQLETLLQSWEGKKSCTKLELDSLIGQLQQVIKPGRSFLRRMIGLAKLAKKPSLQKHLGYFNHIFRLS